MMTLIASFSVGNSWFMLGDFLISGDEQENQTLHLPSIGNISQIFPQGSGFVPTRLQRKICHFGNMAIAWSGRYIEAKKLITDLYKEFQESGPITLDMLDRTLHSLDHESDLGILGYIKDPRNNQNIGFGRNYSDLVSSTLGHAKILGSGSELFAEYFDHQTSFEFELPVGIERNGFEASVCTALIFTGMLLQLELGTNETLLRYFGGGYELIALTQDRFILFDDLMYVFWFANIDDKGITLTPILKFFKQSYYQDILIIRTLEMTTPDPKKPLFLTERNDEVHYLAPIYRTPTPQEISVIPTPDLAAFMLCSYILVKSNKGIEVLTKFDWSKSRELPLRFVDNNGVMEMQIQPKYFKDIFSAMELRI
jgi:hypothetical protein